MQIRVLLAAMVVIGATQPLLASDRAFVKRGTPERQGDAWVEQVTCGAPVREGGRLIFRADAGSLAIKPGANDRMECQVMLRAYGPSEAKARRFFADYQLSVRTLEAGGAHVESNIAGERHRSRRFSVDFYVSVPTRFNLDLETQGGDVRMERLDGEVRAVTAGGNIRTGDVSGPLQVETAGGNISLGNIGRRAEARTAGGSIHAGDIKGEAVFETSGGEIVTGFIDGPVRAETAAGDIALRGASGPVVTETAGGQIQIGEAGGSVRAATAGGSIRVRRARGMVEAESAGGSIDLFQVQGGIRAETSVGRILAQINADRNTFSASRLETSMGDLQVYLPPDLPLTIDAAIENAVGHKIRSDFVLDIQGESDSFMPRSVRGRGAVNGGGQVLLLRAVAGDIEIRKLDARTLEELKSRQDAYWQGWEQRQATREKRRQSLEDRGRKRKGELIEHPMQEPE